MSILAALRLCFVSKTKWIALATDLAQVDLTSADRLLDPQGLRIKFVNLAQTLPLADNDCCAGVRPHAQRHVQAQVGK